MIRTSVFSETLTLVQIQVRLPIYASVVKMDISRNATDIEFGVRILIEAPIFL